MLELFVEATITVIQRISPSQRIEHVSIIDFLGASMNAHPPPTDRLQISGRKNYYH